MAPEGCGQMLHSAGGVPGSAGGCGRPDHVQGAYSSPPPSAGEYQNQADDGKGGLVFEIGRDPTWPHKAMVRCPTVLEQYQVALVDTRVKLAATADGLSSLKSDKTRHGSARLWPNAPQCWSSTR